MRQSQEIPTNVTDRFAEIGHVSSLGEAGEKASGEQESSVTGAEALQLRQEKLAAIQQAIARGDYDSDELLERALDRMLNRIEESGDQADR